MPSSAPTRAYRGVTKDDHSSAGLPPHGLLCSLPTCIAKALLLFLLPATAQSSWIWMTLAPEVQGLLNGVVATLTGIRDEPVHGRSIRPSIVQKLGSEWVGRVEAPVCLIGDRKSLLPVLQSHAYTVRPFSPQHLPIRFRGLESPCWLCSLLLV